MVYTARLAGGRGGRNAFEHELRRRHVVQKNSRPNHPTTCGKVERFQQTMKKWLRAQPVQPTTITELQALLDALRRAVQPPPPAPLPAPPGHPGTRYNTMPKALPGETPDPDTHDRIRHDTVDKAGTVTLRQRANSTTSASGEPTPEPASSSSSRTSRSGSSTPSPENSSAS